jgi:hypothetical protein
MRIGRPGRARFSLVQQSPLLRGRFSFQDEAGGSSPPRPTIVVLTCGNSRRLSPSTAAGAIRRLGTAVSERIPALLSSNDYGSRVEREVHVQVLWQAHIRVGVVLVQVNRPEIPGGSDS